MGRISVLVAPLLVLGCGTYSKTDPLPGGASGSNGVSSLIRVEQENVGSNCLAAGAKVLGGEDSNRDGTLQDDEVESTAYVCGVVLSASPNRVAALIRLEQVGVGGNCAAGGTMILSGGDANGDGTLQYDEVTSTTFACSVAGADAVSLIRVDQEPPGPNCSAGGSKISSGIDIGKDGILQDSEVTSGAYVCTIIERCEAAAVLECAQAYRELGQCRLGTHTCGSDGRWGACFGAVAPAAEICDLEDNDCDGQVDDGVDDDHDLFGAVATSATCSKNPDGAPYDCDDDDAWVHPEATEVCDGRDNDCDGKIDGADDSLVTVACPKQSGVCAGSRKACVGGVQQACTSASYGPDYMTDEALCKGEATDPGTCNGRLACDGKDNDCDGTVDEGFADYDHDLFGAQGTKCTKNPMGAPYDCNDADPAVFPGALEVCDGRDDDCSGVPDDGTAPVQMTCVFGSSALNCPQPSGSALGNCSADCANPCAAPADICNGLDDDGDGTIDKRDEYVSGPWSLAGTNTMSATLTAMPEGGYLAAYLRQVASRTYVGLQRLNGKASHGIPEAGPVIEVANIAGSVRKVAVTPYHVVWLDTVEGHTGVRAAGLSKGLAVGAAFDVFGVGSTLEVENLTATSLGEGTTLIAAGVQGGSFVFVRVLTGNRTIIPTTAQVAGASNPSFGALPSGPVLFFERITGGIGNIAWREVSTQGDVSATEYAISPAPPSGTNYLLPSGAQSAVAYEKKAGSATQIEVVRIGSAGQVGTPFVVSATGSKPALAAIKSGTDDIYSLGYVGASARFLNLTWSGGVWQKSPYDVGYMMTNLQRVITAGDGKWFAMAYQGQPTTGYDTQLRFNCFFQY